MRSDNFAQFWASGFYDKTQFFGLRILVSKAFFWHQKTGHFISILGIKIIHGNKTRLHFPCFYKLKKRWTVYANLVADDFFAANKNLGGEILKSQYLFSAAFARQFCRVFSVSPKTCGFEKHGFQNRKAAANTGFVQAGLDVMGWRFVFQYGF